MRSSYVKSASKHVGELLRRVAIIKSNFTGINKANWRVNFEYRSQKKEISVTCSFNHFLTKERKREGNASRVKSASKSRVSASLQLECLLKLIENDRKS